MFPASLSTAIAVLLITTATTEGQNNTLCGTKGYFCPEEFQTQVSNRSCGKYSDVFREPNVTMQQDVVPLANYTYTNNSEVIDNTTYLSEVLQSKAYELYSDEELGMLHVLFSNEEFTLCIIPYLLSCLCVFLLLITNVSFISDEPFDEQFTLCINL